MSFFLVGDDCLDQFGNAILSRYNGLIHCEKVLYNGIAGAISNRKHLGNSTSPMRDLPLL